MNYQQQQAYEAGFSYGQQQYYGQGQQQQYGQQQYYQQEAQQMPPATYHSIDVECVATGTDHNARSIAQISLVDEYSNVLLNMYVRPDKPIVSYLTPLTGITKEMLDQYGMPLEAAIANLKSALPKHAVLVGQNIGKDVQWLGLREGHDFQGMMDLAGIYRVYNEKYRSWSIFGQDHVAKVLLNWQAPPQGQNEHDAVTDALKSIALFNHYLQNLKEDAEAMKKAQAALLAAPQDMSFARRNPAFEGVCMGNRKTCSCGAAFLSS